MSQSINGWKHSRIADASARSSPVIAFSASELKAVNPDVPVILSSGFSEMEVLKSLAADSIAGFLQKPYTAAHLRDAVGAAVAEAA